ncbi:TetR/AcrR family transcriptional regulator [Brevibacterium sp.]|uniref:TetR/AcrR family transcriptional regulator n=1 Tax=Brevibacterium sp. TaxID=1701 RepID=UPI0026492A29|nr:helix-turn-helix domain-containing protein [Brevibacterium sp.]MDN6605896.1 TetR/AcrR family transcriptional regulator [Brevibacterium sp.]
MGIQSDRAREVLLNSAEELFAVHGIDAVSNRRIVDHAGAANHSAISYHFGGREGLLRALVERHVAEVAHRRDAYVESLGASPSIHDFVRCRMGPLFDVLADLPRPSWRAQFLAQVAIVPSAVEIMKSVVAESSLPEDLRFIHGEMDGIPEGVLRGRAYLLAHMVTSACSDQEVKMNEGTHQGDWEQVGRFLIDAAAGMLAGRVTSPDGAIRYPSTPLL